MKILFVLHAGLEQSTAATAVALAKEAKAKGADVTLFAMSAGVTNLASEKFTALVKDSLSVTVCEHNRKEYATPESVEGVHYGSQFDLAGYVADTDRALFFG